MYKYSDIIHKSSVFALIRWIWFAHNADCINLLLTNVFTLFQLFPMIKSREDIKFRKYNSNKITKTLGVNMFMTTKWIPGQVMKVSLLLNTGRKGYFQNGSG